MPSCVVLRWDTVQNGWAFIVVMTVIYKYGDVDNVICFKNIWNSTKYLAGIKKMALFSRKCYKFFAQFACENLGCYISLKLALF